MSESTQIVRSLRSGEFPPAYSTDELMRGVCHIVTIPVTQKKVPEREKKHLDHDKHFSSIKNMLEYGETNNVIAANQRISIADVSTIISNFAELRRLSLLRRCSLGTDRHFDQIKRLVLEGKSAIKIGQEIGINRITVQRYIQRVHELSEIYASMKHAPGCGKRSIEKFNAVKDKVMKALETRSFRSVRTEFGFSCDSLKKHLARVGFDDSIRARIEREKSEKSLRKAIYYSENRERVLKSLESKRRADGVLPKQKCSEDERKARARASSVKWRESNKERNKELKKAAAQRYYLKNKDKCIARNRAWHDRTKSLNEVKNGK